MKWIVRLLGLMGFAIGAFWFGGVQRRMREHGWSLGEVVKRDFRSFVTHRFNPLVMRLGLAGGRRSPWAIVEHVGRSSGTVYRSPLLPMTAGNFLFVPLTYGEDVHWVKNVRAAGHCRIQQHEMILELDEPVIVAASDNPAIPDAVRGAAERSGRRYLRLHVLERVPGTFARLRPGPEFERPLEPESAPLTVHAPALEMIHPGAEASPERVTT